MSPVNGLCGVLGGGFLLVLRRPEDLIYWD